MVRSVRYYDLIPNIVLAHIVIGSLVGWVIYDYRREMNKRIRFQHLRNGFRIICCFILAFIVRQLSTNNAFEAGTPLGEPDFDGLTTALAITIGVIFTIRFTKENIGGNIKNGVKYALIASIIQSVVFALIYLFFQISIKQGLFEDDNCLFSPYSSSCSVFKFSFNDPTKVYLIFISNLIFFTLLTIFSKNDSR